MRFEAPLARTPTKPRLAFLITDLWREENPTPHPDGLVRGHVMSKPIPSPRHFEWNWVNRISAVHITGDETVELYDETGFQGDVLRLQENGCYNLVLRESFKILP